MVHLRLNERETNPNPYINFISALNAEEDSRQLLRALAAQVKPVMKAHGLTVNSLEEVRHMVAQNRLFAVSKLGLFLFSMNIIRFSLGEIGIMERLLVSVPCLCTYSAAFIYYCTELVLRSTSGSFLPTAWLISTFCHEVRVYDFWSPVELMLNRITISWPISK
jgi:hypothetical protein